MVLNSLICWADVRGAVAAAEEFHVLCLSHGCCEYASSIGIKTIGRNGTYEMYLNNRVGYTREPSTPELPRSHLDDVMLVRDHAIQHLLHEGFSVFLSDADSCFLKDPMILIRENNLHLLSSAQPCKLPFWSSNYSCTDDYELSLTLNGGIAYHSGSKDSAKFTAFAIGQAYRFSVSPNPKVKDGYGQKGMNVEAAHHGLCLTSTSLAKQKTWGGEPLFGKINSTELKLNVGVFSVCSPCDNGAFCEDAFAVHANCRLGHHKQKFLHERGVWFLADSWVNMVTENLGLEGLLRLLHK
jgi:hypothetical protein